jgi:hypothetical protein
MSKRHRWFQRHRAAGRRHRLLDIADDAVLEHGAVTVEVVQAMLRALPDELEVDDLAALGWILSDYQVDLAAADLLRAVQARGVL